MGEYVRVPEAEARSRLDEDAVVEVSRAWWLFLVTGIAWFLVSLIVLRFQTESLVTVGILVGVFFLGAGLNEVLAASLRGGWRWVHVVMAVLFISGALWAFVYLGSSVANRSSDSSLRAPSMSPRSCAARPTGPSCS